MGTKKDNNLDFLDLLILQQMTEDKGDKADDSPSYLFILAISFILTLAAIAIYKM